MGVRHVPQRAGHGNRLVLGLVKGGLVGSQIALVVSVASALLVWGSSAAANTAIASAITIVFFATGQAVDVLAIERADATGMIVSLASFVLRAGGLGLLLWLAMNTAEAERLVHPAGLLLGALVTTLGWVGGVVWVGRRQRVLVHDTDYTPPEDWDA